MSDIDMACEKLAKFRGCSAGEVRAVVTAVLERIESDPSWTISKLHSHFSRKWGCSKGDIRAICF